MTVRLQLNDLERFRDAQATYCLTSSDERFPIPNASPTVVSKPYVLQTSLHLPVLVFKH